MAFFVGLLASRAAAQGSELLDWPCRAVLVKPANEELGLRIAGQSQDVACELEVVAQAEAESCEALARGHHAQAVLRVREPAPGAGYEVVVCDAVAQSERARAVPIESATDDALRASAAYEAVALVVRSALVDIASEYGARREQRVALLLEQQRAREQAARAAQERAPRAREQQERATRAREQQAARGAQDEDDEVDEDDADLSTEERSSGPYVPIGLQLGAGAELAAIGADGPAVELTARLLFEAGALRLGAGFSYGLPATLADDSASLSLSRHSGVLIVELPFVLSQRVTLGAEAHAGVAALRRSTSPREPAVTAANDVTHWSALVGVEVGAALRLVGPLGARVHAALDVVPGAPRYAYRDEAPAAGPAMQTQLARPSYVQPRAGITLFVSF